jgi:hypothetical protein
MSVELDVLFRVQNIPDIPVASFAPSFSASGKSPR